MLGSQAPGKDPDSGERDLKVQWSAVLVRGLDSAALLRPQRVLEMHPAALAGELVPRHLPERAQVCCPVQAQVSGQGLEGPGRTWDSQLVYP